MIIKKQKQTKTKMKNPDYTLTFNKKKINHINQIDIFKSLKKKIIKKKGNVTSKQKVTFKRTWETNFYFVHQLGYWLNIFGLNWLPYIVKYTIKS